MRNSLILLATLSFASACDNDPGEGKATAAVGEAVAPVAAAPAEGAQKLSFSDQGSKLDYVGAKVTRKHEGAFTKFQGTIDLVEQNPEKSSVKVEVDVGSLTADEEKLANHLKSPDFFDVATHPKATFESTAIKAGGAGGATHTVTGNLTLHGVTKSITFPATIKLAPGAVDVAAEFVINRKDFGIVYPGMPDDLIKDDVLLKLDVHAK